MSETETITVYCTTGEYPIKAKPVAGLYVHRRIEDVWGKKILVGDDYVVTCDGRRVAVFTTEFAAMAAASVIAPYIVGKTNEERAAQRTKIMALISQHGGTR